MNTLNTKAFKDNANSQPKCFERAIFSMFSTGHLNLIVGVGVTMPSI